MVADEAEVSCVERRHYLLRSGLADGDTLTGPGADEHMPIAWPRGPDDPLPPTPKGLPEGLRGRMRRAMKSGFLPFEAVAEGETPRL